MCDCVSEEKKKMVELFKRFFFFLKRLPSFATEPLFYTTPNNTENYLFSNFISYIFG